MLFDYYFTTLNEPTSVILPVGKEQIVLARSFVKTAGGLYSLKNSLDTLCQSDLSDSFCSLLFTQNGKPRLLCCSDSDRQTSSSGYSHSGGDTAREGNEQQDTGSNESTNVPGGNASGGNQGNEGDGNGKRHPDESESADGSDETTTSSYLKELAKRLLTIAEDFLSSRFNQFIAELLLEFAEFPSQLRSFLKVTDGSPKAYSPLAHHCDSPVRSFYESFRMPPTRQLSLSGSDDQAWRLLMGNVITEGQALQIVIALSEEDRSKLQTAIQKSER